MFVDRQAGEEAWKQTATSLQPSSTSGHFVYDKHHLTAIRQKWAELISHYNASIVASTEMDSVDGPGADYASRGHAADANISGTAYSQSLNASLEYCTNQIAKYDKVLGIVVDTDEEHHRKIQQSGSPLDGGI
ncbi:hypothetical protein EV186_1011258 [Labedaea rhizosphaerae]|uniref:Uncharacterized protein n=1 Tax=Labedaea rhizosphaerae TaxID=598644 RepID=A0A4R6SMC9_LABRH|nr:hypothetical protein EV186_1011258 [Labedaea rhizosphaerae]